MKLPPKWLERVRPKGAEIIVIGRPAKKNRAEARPLPVIKRRPDEKNNSIHNRVTVVQFHYRDAYWSLAEEPASTQDS